MIQGLNIGLRDSTLNIKAWREGGTLHCVCRLGAQTSNIDRLDESSVLCCAAHDPRTFVYVVTMQPGGAVGEDGIENATYWLFGGDTGR
jgi:hypothetical protein